MAAIDKRILELQQRLAQTLETLDLESLRHQLMGLESDMAEPDFWNDQDRAKKISQEASEITQELEMWDSFSSDLKEVAGVAELAESESDAEMIEELERNMSELETRFRKLELRTFFGGPYDASGAIVSIHAGAGGTDAQDWAGMLTRMFTRFAESRGWRVEMHDTSPGEEAGYKSVTFAVEGRFAFGYFKGEAGVHRLVRISPFDGEKMRHTSFALVEVIPQLDELSEKNLHIDDKDLRIDTFASSGAGGQSVNTTNSAVRITHVPTSTVVSIQNERSQQQNKETAMRVLKARLFTRMQEERAEKIDELRGGHKSPEWGNQIRSYVLHPYQMVKDHRTNHETQDVNSVLDGDLESFMEAFLRSQIGEQE